VERIPRPESSKVKSGKGIYTVEGAVIDTISDAPMRVLSIVDSDVQGSYKLVEAVRAKLLEVK